MKKIISLLTVTFLLVQFTNCKKDDKVINTIKNDGVINFTLGNINIVVDDKTAKANVGDKITQGMTIITAAKSVVDIHFEGSVIRILEKSSVSMKTLVKSLSDSKELTELYVQNGKMFTQVTRKLTDNEKFSVRTPTSVAVVRGTEFLVEEENGKSRISCIKGRVAVKDASEEGDLSFVDVDSGKAANVEQGKPITIVELAKGDLDNIRRIKDDIKPLREDIKADAQKLTDDASASGGETKKSEAAKEADAQKRMDEGMKDLESKGSDLRKRVDEPSDELKKSMDKSFEAEKRMNEFFGD